MNFLQIRKGQLGGFQNLILLSNFNKESLIIRENTVKIYKNKIIETFEQKGSYMHEQLQLRMIQESHF